MAGSFRHLLAVFSLLFSLIFSWAIFSSLILCSAIFSSAVLAAPVLLRGQDATVASPSYPAFTTPLTPNLRPRQFGPPADSSFQPLVLQRLVRTAGIIFSGRVTFIGHTTGVRPDPASTAITFQVEHAIRGAVGGQRLTIHEWAGLWRSGERYHVGEQVLLFLYSPSKLGLTSPVAGDMGRFAMDPQGRIMISALHAATLAEDPMLSGKTVVPYADFAVAVRRSNGEQ